MKDTKFSFFFGVFVGFVLAGVFFFFFFKVAHAQTRPMSPQAYAVADGIYRQVSYQSKADEAGYGYSTASYDYLANSHYGVASYVNHTDNYSHNSEYGDAVALNHVEGDYDVARSHYAAGYLDDNARYTYRAAYYIG